mgnify:CR=1 FL=1
MTTPTSTPLTPAPAPKGWWGHNWKWALPIGCISITAVCVGVILTGLFVGLGYVRSSGPYVDAMARVRASTEVTDTIGMPVEEEFLVSGNFNATPTSGAASMAIPIKGPKGKATVYVSATRSGSVWTFSSLYVDITATQERIDLLGK